MLLLNETRLEGCICTKRVPTIDDMPTFRARRVDRADGSIVIDLEGELDLESIGEAGEVFAGLEGATLVVVDLARLSFLGVCGLRTLVDAQQRLEERGAHLRFVAVHRATMRRMLGLVGLFAEDDELDRSAR